MELSPEPQSSLPGGHGSPLVEIRGLVAHIGTDDGYVPAIDGVDLSIRRGETLGMVGESGSGKSMTAFAIMRLIPRQIIRKLGGEILYYPGGKETSPVDINKLEPTGRPVRRIRGQEIGMVFQEPMSSLSPVHTIGNQVSEAILLHQKLNRKETRERSIELLHKVRLPNPARQMDAYPHELSGGMRQRVMIAIALSCNPSLLIADEPTTALDVTIQAQILDLLEELQAEFNMAILLITHDLGVVARVAERVAVMYLGKIVEVGNVDDLFHNPSHPYTQALLRSIPRLGQKQRLEAIKGSIPDSGAGIRGCAFSNRCPHVHDKCLVEPNLFPVSDTQSAACWLDAGSTADVKGEGNHDGKRD